MNAAWDRAFPQCQHDAAGRRTLQSMRFGIQALTTPPWAQDIGHADHGCLDADIEEVGQVTLIVD